MNRNILELLLLWKFEKKLLKIKELKKNHSQSFSTLRHNPTINMNRKKQGQIKLVSVTFPKASHIVQRCTYIGLSHKITS